MNICTYASVCRRWNPSPVGERSRNNGRLLPTVIYNCMYVCTFVSICMFLHVYDYRYIFWQIHICMYVHITVYMYENI